MTAAFRSHYHGSGGARTMIRQVWLNLLTNALKFSARQPEPAIQVGTFEDEGQTIYFVRYNGVGFDMRYYDKLFGVFQRLHSDDEFQGTGVGLAIVQRVLTRHGERVWRVVAQAGLCWAIVNKVPSSL